MRVESLERNCFYLLFHYSNCYYVKQILCIGALLFVSAILGKGDVLLSDNFDSYTNGPLVVVSGRVWQETAPGTNGTVDAVSGRVYLVGGPSREDVHADLINGPYAPASGAVLYVSLTINCTNRPMGGGTYFAHLRGNANTHYCRIFATANGAAANSFRVGIANYTNSDRNSASAVLAVNLELHTNYTIVARYVVSNAVSTLWVNPISESDGGVSATDAAPAITITSLGFRQAMNMGSLFVDNLLVTNRSPLVRPAIATHPQNQVASEGASAIFSVEGSGTPPFTYQWHFNASDLPGATNPILSLPNVTASQAGSYSVTVGNLAGVTNSDPATLSVILPSAGGLVTIVTYNVHGFGVADWSTNSTQVQAIGRQMAFLHPDIIAFNEVPFDNTWEMTNFVTAYLPGYFLATNSGSDAFHSTRSVIASRFPIMRSTKWLDGADLTAFGYTNTHFTRDLFEAQISVPRFPRPLHVFTTHLKATDSSGQQDDADKRAAEASAISNFFVTVFLPGNPLHPYILTGDMNEDVLRPDTGSYNTGQPVQRLTSPPTGLNLTTPVNPFTTNDRTWSVQNASLNPSKRFDYILPCTLLFENIHHGEVFRTDKLSPTPSSLNQFDDKTASDHLPVLMAFNNPYDDPFLFAFINVSDQSLSLRWETSNGGRYGLEASTNLIGWTAVATNLMATGTTITWSTNLQGDRQFFRVYREL